MVKNDDTDGGRAFPSDGFDKTTRGFIIHPGMSLRDYFAGQALTGFMSRCDPNSSLESVAQQIYVIADAMISARKAAGRG